MSLIELASEYQPAGWFSLSLSVTAVVGWPVAATPNTGVLVHRRDV